MKNLISKLGGIAIPSWVKIAGVGLLALVIVLWFRGCESTQDKRVVESKETGKTEQRAETAEAGLLATEKANAAASKVATDNEARKASCAKYSRTPENC